ncbi:hypothetical protein E2C01_010331 [Portunus trituberculatus]|uniref:Uncharacterized protein n=1 Tax=Portunus trituberculatus TaxID=210409 RepID=A0A5B7D8E4_PORTR|nr:hypothetical protein [Portunus trituberculatus]
MALKRINKRLNWTTHQTKQKPAKSAACSKQAPGSEGCEGTVSVYFPCICEVLEYTSRSRSEALTQDYVQWVNVAAERQDCGSIKVVGARQTTVAQACGRARPCTPARPLHGTRAPRHLQTLW